MADEPVRVNISLPATALEALDRTASNCRSAAPAQLPIWRWGGKLKLLLSEKGSGDVRKDLLTELFASPILVVPLFGLGLGLAFTPLMLFGTEHAAEFYGSVFSAAATVIAVFAASYLAKRQTSNERYLREISEATDLYYWAHQCLLRILYDRDRIKFALDSLRSADNPSARISLKAIKNRMFPVAPAEASARLERAGRLPSALGAKIILVLQVLANQAVFQRDTEDRIDDTKLDAPQLDKIIKGFENTAKLVGGVMAELKAYLLEQNAFTAETFAEMEQALQGIAEGVEARRATDEPEASPF